MTDQRRVDTEREAWRKAIRLENEGALQKQLVRDAAEEVTRQVAKPMTSTPDVVDKRIPGDEHAGA